MVVVLVFAGLALGLYAKLTRVRREHADAERAASVAAARPRMSGSP